MWCSHCHQDVPAIASESLGIVACARCQHELKFTSLTGVTDTGISLDGPIHVGEPSRPVVDRLSNELAMHNLRRIGRQLRPAYQQSADVGKPPFWEQLNLGSAENSVQLRAITQQDQRREKPSSTPWFLGLLIGGGVLSFAIGVASLLWATAINQVAAWQWGLTSTLAGEGLLIVGLTWMAARLWQNSRQLNHDLRDVDTQLTEIHELAGSLTAGQLSGSQQFYHHFSQVANPHMLVANLRGQVDQLAERLAG